MPSPGQAAIATIIGAQNYNVEGGFATQFNAAGVFVLQLAAALHTGWTSASPTTATTMASAFSAEFNGFLTGQGLDFVSCIATGIDQEVAAWVASWDTQLGIHTYTVNAASIVGRIQACATLWSNGAQALAQVVADAFMSGFGQEAG